MAGTLRSLAAEHVLWCAVGLMRVNAASHCGTQTIAATAALTSESESTGMAAFKCLIADPIPPVGIRRRGAHGARLPAAIARGLSDSELKQGRPISCANWCQGTPDESESEMPHCQACCQQAGNWESPKCSRPFPAAGRDSGADL